MKRFLAIAALAMLTACSNDKAGVLAPDAPIEWRNTVTGEKVMVAAVSRREVGNDVSSVNFRIQATGDISHRIAVALPQEALFDRPTLVITRATGVIETSACPVTTTRNSAGIVTAYAARCAGAVPSSTLLATGDVAVLSFRVWQQTSTGTERTAVLVLGTLNVPVRIAGWKVAG